MEMNTEPKEHIFDESLVILNPASDGKRFLNYLVDYLFMNFVLSFATDFLLTQIVGMINPEMVYDLFVAQDTWDLIISSYMFAILNFLIYYTLCEKLFNGQTLGKLVTGTRAVRADGLPLTWKDAILRSLCRLIPFEPFSAFGGNPWHDSLTNTTVVTKN